MVHVAAEFMPQRRCIIRINLRVIASPRDRNVRHAAVEQILSAQLGAGRRRELLQQLQEESRVRDEEFRFRTKTGEIRTGLLSAELIEIEGETYTLTAVSDITERKRAEEALASMSRKLIDAQEQERTRIARDLHDDIGQRLALVSNGLEELHLSSDFPAEISGRIGKLQTETSQIATDVQSLSHELHSSKLDLLGISAAIKGFCREVGEQQHVEVICQTHDLPGNLPPAIALCLFRVLQEALRNSIKHSGVKQVEVRSWGTPKEIHLTIRDSGFGFELKAARSSRGLGLVSMEERLKLVKGTLLINSQPRHGTTIHARVPYPID